MNAFDANMKFLMFLPYFLTWSYTIFGTWPKKYSRLRFAHTYYIWCLRIDPYISKILLWKCEKITIFHDFRCCTFRFFRSLLLLLCFFAAIWSGNGKYDNSRNVTRIISAKYSYLRLWMTILNNFWKRIFCIMWL